MSTRFARALGIAAALAIIAVATMVSWGSSLFGNNQNGIIFAKETKPMAISHSRLSIPPLDTAQPVKFDTATFALG